jgi:hypothetical protein
MLVINGFKNRIRLLRLAHRCFSDKPDLERLIQEKVKAEEAFFLPTKERSQNLLENVKRHQVFDPKSNEETALQEAIEEKLPL